VPKNAAPQGAHHSAEGRSEARRASDWSISPTPTPHRTILRLRRS